ncbi:putative glycosyl transferase, family 4 [Aromatoleum aromaticum EbN1]|uniref:Glycosyl transferase, family 4 n=1 Tax=Aromatoleum aromaticum (strain DSM 19018 / LMG 30748 / EbN1) TaxID=76114 RepID=Q5NY59_AROAE|nr:glycosyltransferase [Aromatoleum aromaticum]CAI10005.1 putative glycosyl transferase, family 4 [Aromatoleum aromaticum EbN1]
MSFPESFFAIAATSCLVALVIVLTKNLHGRFTLDSDHGIQKFHVAPTPRVGGLAVVAALVVGAFTAGADEQAILFPLLLAAVPAFAFGIAEDLTKKVSVTRRLVATLCSGVLAWQLTGIALDHLDLAPVDFILQWLPAAVILTAFAAGGIANAVNMIDGFNGLAGGALVIMFGALGLVAFQVDDVVLASVCWAFAAAFAGFLAINFPAGKIFLGDGGAYLGGFALAWLAILLPERNTAVSPWVSLLICAYPVMELIFSIARRRYREHHPGAADRLHLHSLVHARVVRHFVPADRPTLRNAAVSPLMWLFALVPAGFAQFVWHSRSQCLAVVLLTSAAYLLCYLRLVRFRWPWSSASAALDNAEALDRV